MRDRPPPFVPVVLYLDALIPYIHTYVHNITPVAMSRDLFESSDNDDSDNDDDDEDEDNESKKSENGV